MTANARLELAEHLAAQSDAAVFPTSYAQRRQWFLHQLAPQAGAYAMPLAFTVRGPLDLTALQAAVDGLVARHEALRTTFPARDGRPVQRVAARAAVGVDLRASSEEQVGSLLEEEIARPFDLAHGPLLRVIVWRLAEHEHVLACLVHHIVADGHSVQLLMRDLADGYRARRRGTEPAPRAAALQPADHAVWEATEVRNGGIEDDLTYWGAELAGVATGLSLPTELPPVPAATGPVARAVATMPQALTTRLAEVARELGTTEFVVLLAVFVAALTRFCGQRELVVGIPVSGRVRPEMHDMVGCFVNTLPLRLTCDPQASARELISHVHAKSTAARAHERAPLDLIAARLDTGSTPLFSTVFSVRTSEQVAVDFDELDVRPIEVGPPDAKLDLTCVVVDGRRLEWDYQADGYDPGTINALADCFAAAAEDMLAGLDRRPAELELGRVVEDPETPVEGTILDRFAHWVHQRPDHPAVSDRGHVLTYAELDRRSNQLAHQLRCAGVRAEVPVGVCLRRGADFAVACLAVLKAGGNYLPLDPAYPADRLRFMVDDSGINLVIGEAPGLRDSVVVLDITDPLPGLPETPLGVRVDPQGLCLRIYTSGSTGRPKAVGVTRRGVLDLVCRGEHPGLGPDACVLWISSVSFDVATWEMWGTLLHGGHGVVSPEREYTAAQIGRLVGEHGVTTALFSTALFNALVDEDVTAFRGITTLLVGGEALSPAHVRALAAAQRHTRLFNAYGPAEITTLASCHELGDGDPRSTSIPIGRPMSGTRMTVVDGSGRSVPPGGVGELCLSGSGLARGYLGRPRLTAERFLPAEGGGRWYRTGDLGRMIDDTFVYRGRADRQVKIRGHRVEPGEVEAILAEQEEVATAAVVADRSGGTAVRLLAYAVPTREGMLEGIRQRLLRSLPDYLVPAAVVEVARIPRTSGGKVDLSALPSPTWTAVPREAGPRTSTEDAVAEIWAELLDLRAQRLRREDDFFTVGGHSLLAATVVSRLRERLGVDVPLADAFQRSTLAELAAAVDERRATLATCQEPVRAPRPWRLAPNQERLWFLQLLDPDTCVYNLPLAVRIHGDLDVHALRRAVRWLLLRHEVLRCAITDTEHGPVAMPSEDIPPLSVIDVRGAGDPGRAATNAVREQLRRPFALSGGELPIRALLARSSERDFLACLIVHHIAADGWSVGVIAGELGEAYTAFAQGCEPTLSPPEAQYADIVYRRAQTCRDALDQQSRYWRSALAGAPQVLDLPASKARPQSRRLRGGIADFALGSELVDGVRLLAESVACTQYMVLLGALSVTLAARSDQDEFLIGTPVANRPDPQSQRLVGFFANTVALRMDTAGDPTVRALLRRVGTTCREALGRPDLPFEQLVEDLAPQRDLSRTPLFQVMFAFDNTPQVPLRLPGLDTEPVRLDNPAARVDLTVALTSHREGIDGVCEYDADLFDEEDIAALLAHLKATIHHFVNQPDAPIGQVAVPDDQRARRVPAAEFAAARQPRPAARPPAGDTEVAVAEAWEQVLGEEGAVRDAHADFFALGGQSFSAARVAARLARRFHTELTVRAIFEHPTVAALAELLGSAPTKQTDPPARLPASATGAPMSFAQERLWFLTQFAPESPAYNIPLIARLDGPLDTQALRQALSWLIQRHETLRTRFGIKDGEPWQEVRPAGEAAPAIQETDVAGVSDPAAEAMRIGAEFAYAPFDLDGGDLPIKATLVRTGARRHVLALAVHHLVADGWAIGLLIRDLLTAYEIYAAGRQPDPTPVPLRYLDYAHEQRSRDAGDALPEGLRYWETALRGAPQVLDLPASHPRPAVRRHRGAGVPIEVPATLTARVRELARATGCTEFMVLLAAFGTVLTRYAGQREVLVGTPVANRDAEGTESLLGLLANTVVLRATVRGDATVRRLLEATRTTCLDAFAHAGTPFEQVVQRLAPERDQSRSPVFQVMLALNNAKAPVLRLPELTCTPAEPENPTAKFDVVLNLADLPETVSGVCEFDIDVYDRPMIEALLGHLLAVLEAFTRDPDAHLSTVDMLDARQRHALLREFNSVPARYEHWSCLHHLVEVAVHKNPDAVAVLSAHGAALSYRELDRAANRLAHRMIGHGVRPGEVVGVRVGPTVELVIAEYAVLKAGAAFLPLDPAWPADRMHAVTENAGCRTVLTAGGAPRGGTLEIADTAAEPDTRPEVAVSPRHPAYVIYTSGSTGIPKGVQIPHTAIANNLLWMQQDWPLSPDDRMLHKTTATFDVAVKEVFWPLVTGATVVLAEPGSQSDPESLLEQIERHAITITHFVPSMLQLALDAAERDARGLGSKLRYVMAGAETLPASTARRFFDSCSADLLHMYGPTETTIAVTGWRCRHGETVPTRLPLGKPMPHCALYVLDIDHNPVPPGAWGELHVAGSPVAHGYLGRPADTAKAFVPDPFPGGSGDRMYATGDIVRLSGAGLLEFRGRSDNQVKIRGFRVELGEIEAALRRVRGVRGAVAVAHAASVVAYVVTGDQADPPTASQVRDQLRQWLPQYMVPARVITVPELPLSANGKIDTSSLPDPAGAERDLDDEFVAPRDDVEDAVARVWSHVLGVSLIGVYDDFFALGGHSLQTTEIAALLRERFDKEVALREVFADPTVAGLARVLRTAPDRVATSKIPRRRGRDHLLERHA